MVRWFCIFFPVPVKKTWIIWINKLHESQGAHDDVITWKHFPRCWPFLRGIHRSPVNSPLKGQWRGASIFSLICAWINGWVNNRDTDDLRRQCAPYDVTVMDEMDTAEESTTKLWVYFMQCTLSLTYFSLVELNSDIADDNIENISSCLNMWYIFGNFRWIFCCGVLSIVHWYIASNNVLQCKK